ncbi:metal ABC transporter permease [Verrucomicrobiaceae bacterium R5-34]|uniref:Metal ABC transporter permease n=1 Tax=Oceaniferula flava TaxID=2800421 RepID=A0AAE2V8J5_9BACT|nr:metal ABC transporter permease [Oceaniferula flavus]MBK1831156.1 metal ABC transporter permease [Verrucomicrobiaceae bacterium R5-34]MBK1855672.1 metal ABC transporter permease [Oceaniferula flavus]MBM1136978.1 metal ABC transporter permease [Oceaniferula flavus]
MDQLLQILDMPFFKRALLAAALIGFTNGFVSGFVLLRRSSLVLSALSHTMLPGIVAVVLITGTLNQGGAFVGALLAALAVGLGSVMVTRKTRLPQSTALAIFFTCAFALGVVMLEYAETAQNLEEWLFGSILSVGDNDLLVFFGIAFFTLIASTLFMRPILLTLFEPNVAAVQGVYVRGVNYLLYAMMIVALMASFQAVGSVLSIGLMVVPGAIVSLFTNNTRWLFWGGGAIGSIGSVAAVVLSVIFNIPTGPAIVLVLGALFAVAYFVNPNSGLFSRAQEQPLQPKHQL